MTVGKASEALSVLLAVSLCPNIFDTSYQILITKTNFKLLLFYTE